MKAGWCVLAGAAVLLGAGEAKADRLDDLVARLDRLEGENAALKARLRAVEKGGAVRTARSSPKVGSPIQVAAALGSPAPERLSAFDGSYVGGSAGYAARDNKYSGPVNSDSPAFYNYGSIVPIILQNGQTRLPTSSGDIGGFAGYGRSFGPLYLGFEARGILKNQVNTDRSDNQFLTSLPIYGGQLPLNPPPPDPFTLGRASGVKTSMRDYGGGDLNARFGLILSENLMFYGRLGGGVETFNARTIFVDSATTCTAPVVNDQLFGSRFGPPSILRSITGCSAAVANFATRKSDRVLLNPYLTLGSGIEANIGDGWFLRAEGEVVSFLAGASTRNVFVDSYYEFRGTGGLGYRW